jgi:hypothetical protein
MRTYTQNSYIKIKMCDFSTEKMTLVYIPDISELILGVLEMNAGLITQ